MWMKKLDDHKQKSSASVYELSVMNDVWMDDVFEAKSTKLTMLRQIFRNSSQDFSTQTVFTCSGITFWTGAKCFTRMFYHTPPCNVIEYPRHTVIRLRGSRGNCMPVYLSRNLKRVDTDSFINELLNTDWTSVFDADSTVEKWQAFVSIFLPCLDEVAPVRPVQPRSAGAPPITPLAACSHAITPETRALLGHRQRSLRLGSADYKEINRQCRAAVRRDSREHFQRELD